MCRFTTLTLPSMTQGWLVVLLENPMVGDTIEAGTNTALKCNSRTSFMGPSGAFLYGPTCSVRQTRDLAQPLLDIAGASQFYVEGINFQTESQHTPEGKAQLSRHRAGRRGSVRKHGEPASSIWQVRLLD